jgi:hypothetical protein
MASDGKDKDLERFLRSSGLDQDKARGLADYVVGIEGAMVEVKENIQSGVADDSDGVSKRLATKRLPEWMPVAKEWSRQYSTWLVNAHEIEVARCTWLKAPGKKSQQNAQKLESFFNTMSAWLSAPLIVCQDGKVNFQHAMLIMM